MDLDREREASALAAMEALAAEIHNGEAAGENSIKVESVETIRRLPPPDWVLDGVLQKQTLALLYGPSGCGKSFLGLDLAFCVAMRRPWFGHQTDDPTGVLYVAAEASGGIGGRVRAWFQEHEMDGEAYCPLDFVRRPVNLLDPEAVPLLLDAYAQGAGIYRLIIIDTLSRCLAGGEENSATDMTAAVQVLDHVRAETGAAVLVLHHTPLSDSARPRGHSSLFAAADTAITVENLGGIRKARLAYQRDGNEGEQWYFRLRQVELGVDRHLRPLTSCVVEPVEAASNQADKPLTGNVQIAYDALVAVVDTGSIESEKKVNHAATSGTSPSVPVERWRDEFYARVIDGRDIKRDTRRKTFQRAAEKLQALGKAGFRDGFAWVIW